MSQAGEGLAVVQIEVTRPLVDIVGLAAKRLQVELELDGEPLGDLWLPVIDGGTTAAVLADQIAARFAWPLLGHFFGRSLYPRLERRHEEGAMTLWLDGQPVPGPLPLESDADSVHDAVGWLLFLRDLWARPTWSAADFYRPDLVEPEGPPLQVTGAMIPLELSEPLPDLVGASGTVAVAPRLAGVALGVLSVESRGTVVPAQAVRAAITGATAFELCVAVVREAIVGRPLEDPPSTLRERLAETRRRRTPPPDSAGLVLGRRHPADLSGAAARHAALPASAAAALADMATRLGEPLRWHPAPSRQAGWVRYDPGWLPEAKPSEGGRHAEPRSPRDSVALGRAYWEGGAPDPDPTSWENSTTRLPILLYHRVSDEGSRALARYRVSPTQFEAQLRFLRDAGYHSVGLNEWGAAMSGRRPLPGLAVALTFDDGYADFAEQAWPLLERYGFSATVFLVADEIGGSNRWDEAHGETLPLMDWATIRRLQEGGVDFGSHTLSHPRLSRLSTEEVVRELLGSRVRLEEGLGRPVPALAYPFGMEDEAVQHLTGAVGYCYGLTCRPGAAPLAGSPLALPRIEIEGGDSQTTFIRKLTLG